MVGRVSPGRFRSRFNVKVLTSIFTTCPSRDRLVSDVLLSRGLRFIPGLVNVYQGIHGPVKWRRSETHPLWSWGRNIYSCDPVCTRSLYSVHWSSRQLGLDWKWTRCGEGCVRHPAHPSDVEGHRRRWEGTL